MIREHVRSNVVGYIALLGFVVAGTASALPGKNTVDSRDIKNRQVKRVDLRNGAVDRSKLAVDAVSGPIVADGSLRGADVADGSLTGADIADAGLPPADDVNAARLGGRDASEYLAVFDDSTNGRPMSWAAFTLGTGGPAGQLSDLGLIALRTTGAPDSFLVCNDTTTINDMPVVVYTGASRTVLSLDAQTCSGPQAIADGEDFRVVGANRVAFGVHTGFPQSDNYAVLALISE